MCLNQLIHVLRWMLLRQVEHQQSFKKGKGAKGGSQGGAGDSRRRQGRKQNASSGLDISSEDRGISAS